MLPVLLIALIQCDNDYPDSNGKIFEMPEKKFVLLPNGETYAYIEQKPPDVKKIFYLFYNIGLSIPEIAGELSLSESGVKNKLYRTIKELRNLLMKE